MSTATIMTTGTKPLNVRGHSGADMKVPTPTWFVLKPEASDLIEEAAYMAASGMDVLITASSPDGDFAVRDANRGAVKLHENRTTTKTGSIRAVRSVCWGKDKSGVRMMNEAILRAKGTKTLQMSVDSGSRAAGKLLSAAVLLSGGRDVMFWTDGTKLHVLDMDAGE